MAAPQAYAVDPVTGIGFGKVTVAAGAQNVAHGLTLSADEILLVSIVAFDANGSGVQMTGSDGTNVNLNNPAGGAANIVMTCIPSRKVTAYGQH